MDLNNILKLIANDIKKNSNKCIYCKDKEFSLLSYSIKVEKVNSLLSEMSSSKYYPYFYMKRREGHYLIGIGKSYVFNNETLELTIGKIESFTSLNEHLKILGGIHFDRKEISQNWKSFGQYYFFIPFIFYDEKDGVLRVYSFKKGVASKENLSKKLLKKIANFLNEKNNILTYENIDLKITKQRASEDLSKEDWIMKVNQILRIIKTSESKIKKIVLARKKNIFIDDEKIWSFLGDEIRKKRRHSYTIHFSPCPGRHFLCFSPERLFKIENESIFVESLAGTIARGNNDFEDKYLANVLKTSDKDIKEHSFVSQMIEEFMEKFCTSYNLLKNKEILKLDRIQHIYSSYVGRIKKKSNIFKILNYLHPTPAVGGVPQRSTVYLLKKLEGFDRGFYSAPIGFISKTETEFAVGIRSFRLIDGKMTAYAGAGIVEDSIPHKEWEETEIKFKSFQDLISK